MYLVHKKPTKKREVLTGACRQRSCFKCKYNQYCPGCDSRCDAKFDVNDGVCFDCDRVCQLGKNVPNINKDDWNFVPDLSYVNPVGEMLFQIKGSAYDLERNYVVSIRKIFNQRFSGKGNIKERLNIPKGCKVYLTFCVKDPILDRFWEQPDEKWDKIVDYGFDGMFSPNYSLYTNVPMSEKIWNWYRQRESIRRAAERGLDVIPEVSFTRKEELDVCCDWLLKTGVQTVYVTYQTVAFRVDTEAWKNEMALLERAVSRLQGKQFVIIGAQIKRRRDMISEIVENPVFVDDICYRLSDCMMLDKNVQAPPEMTKGDVFKLLSEKQLNGEYIENSKVL